MRVDKFLWSIRFYKTRTKATEEVKKNRVSLGDKVVKSSKEVREGDVLKIRKNQIDYKIKVLLIPKSRLGAKLVPLHIVDQTDTEQYDLLRSRKSQQDYYRTKGEGRPTKKDRRSIDGFVSDDEPKTQNKKEDEGDFTNWEHFFSEDED